MTGTISREDGVNASGAARSDRLYPAKAHPRRRRAGALRRPRHIIETRRRIDAIARVRREIDLLDRRIVRLLNDRARLGLDAGRAKSQAGGRPVRDARREREVLMRVARANTGPLPMAILLAIYRRLMAANVRLEEHERHVPPRPHGHHAHDAEHPAEG